MLKAGSLSYTIFVSTVTAILCLLMILLAYFNRSFFIQNDIYDKVRDNSESGIAIGITADSKQDFQEWKELFDERGDSVRISKRKWGAFEVVNSLAQIGEVKYDKTAVIASIPIELENTVLWLSDRNRPLQISGDALLKGNVMLPKKGVDRAYIEGSNYSRKELVFGEQKVSNSQLPKLSLNLEEYWKSYFDKKTNSLDSLVDFEKAPQKQNHSFANKTAVYHSNEPIKLDGYQHSGNAIFISTKSIDVGSSSKLDQVVLLAPKIEIVDGFKGSVHAIASDTLLIGKAVLEYPSSCIVVSKDKKIPYFKLGSEGELRGCLLAFEEKTTRKSNSLAIEIEEKALVTGFIYCTGNIELMGKVNGSVFTNNFLLKTPSGIYENHLLNGKLDRGALDKRVAGFALESYKFKKEAVLWF